MPAPVVYDCDGFDYASTPTILRDMYGWTSTGGSIVTGLLGTGHGYSMVNTTTQRALLGGPFTTLFAQYRFKTDSTTANQPGFRLVAGVTRVIEVGMDASGHLVIKNAAGTVIATGTTVLSGGSTHQVEVKCIVGASGTYELWLDGNPTAEIASGTANFGVASIDGYSLAVGTSSSTFDDISFSDSQLGDSVVETGFPTGAGGHSQWTPDTGSNYARVNESTGTYPDSDTSYVQDSTSGHYDTYPVTTLSSGTLYGVKLNLVMKKTEAGLRQVKPVIRQNSTDYDGNTLSLAAGGYLRSHQMYSPNDGSGAAWTDSNFNAAEFGVKVV